ncbi:MAG: hypothetical protein HY063_05265 [Bacteroidetes bacterium]|nr:hypothetical protein [Bacteroidota bacterium]
MKKTLQVGKEILFTDTNDNLVKCKIKKVHIGEGNKIIGCEATTADNDLIDLTIEESGEIYKEISFSEMQIGMKIVFNDPENKFQKGEVTKISLGEENKITGCDVLTSKESVFELSAEEDKIYALFSDGASNNSADNSAEQKDSSKSETGTASLVGYGILFAIIGFGVGYFIFGKIPFVGTYVPLDTLFGTVSNDNALVDIISNGIMEPIKQNIYISTGVGGVVGIVIAVIKNNK